MTTTVERFGEDFGGERMWGLQELALPEPPPFVPQTWGWLVVGLVLLGLLGWLVWRLVQHRRRQAYRRTALARVAAVASGSAPLSELPLVLRQAALAAFPRAAVAGLQGQEWIDWLNHSAGRELFRTEQAAQLRVAGYAPDAALDDDKTRALIAAARRWLKTHRA